MKKSFKIVVVVATIISIISTLFVGMELEHIYASTENILARAYWTHYAESWEEYDKDILNTNWTNYYSGFDANISMTGWQQLWIVDYHNYGQVRVQIAYGSYAFSREVTKDLASGEITQSRYNSLIAQRLLLAPYTNQEDNLTGKLSFEVELNRKASGNSTSNLTTDAGTTNLEYSTSTNSILGHNSYSSLLSSLSSSSFSEFKKTLATKNSNPVDGVIIPGLAQTDQGKNTVCRTMIPQGVCVAGNYLLVSAYDNKSEVEVKDSNYKHSDKHNSVIYVIDKNTKKYITTIILENNTSHVGALAWNGKTGSDGLIYIADST